MRLRLGPCGDMQILGKECAPRLKLLQISLYALAEAGVDPGHPYQDQAQNDEGEDPRERVEMAQIP